MWTKRAGVQDIGLNLESEFRPLEEREHAKVPSVHWVDFSLLRVWQFSHRTDPPDPVLLEEPPPTWIWRSAAAMSSRWGTTCRQAKRSSTPIESSDQPFGSFRISKKKIGKKGMWSTEWHMRQFIDNREGRLVALAAEHSGTYPGDSAQFILRLVVRQWIMHEGGNSISNVELSSWGFPKCCWMRVI
jgi:hypothetical protein